MRDGDYFTSYFFSELLSKEDKKKVEEVFYKAIRQAKLSRVDANNLEKLSIQDNFFAEKFWEKNSPQEYYFNYLQWKIEEYEGIEFDKQSLECFETDEYFEGGNIIVKGGFITLLNFLNKGLDIRLSHEVVEIENYDVKGGEKLVKVTTNKGIFRAREVVLTVPVGVIKDNLIKFKPELPQWKLNAIKNLGMGLMDKVIMKFDKFYWNPKTYRLVHISKIKGEFPWIDNLSETEPVLMAWVACSFAEKMEKMEDKEIIEEVVKILRKILNINDIPLPQEYYISRWGQDKYSKGSWCGKIKFKV